MATWYPSALTYWQWCQANSFLSDFRSQSNNIRNEINEQSSLISDQTRTIVATSEQITLAVEDGFDRISNINESGFSAVTSAIEAMHSAMNYNFGILIQKIEYQNRLLNQILTTLQEPFETQVREFYNKGCLLVQQGLFNKAIEYFKSSISMPTGDIFFSSFYQLGRLYMTANEESVKISEIKKATKYLLEADILGNGIYRTNEEFKPILADCKFLISLSYYFQLTGKSDFVENEYLSNAIAYCEVSVILNENLSQGYYHLAKYYAYANDCKKLLQNLKKAIEIDRDYSWKWENDKVFEDHKPLIFEFLSNLKEQKRIKAVPLLDKAKHYISKFESKNISQFPNLKAEFNELKQLITTAEKDFKTGTYFGFDDCNIKLENL